MGRASSAQSGRVVALHLPARTGTPLGFLIGTAGRIDRPARLRFPLTPPLLSPLLAFLLEALAQLLQLLLQLVQLVPQIAAFR